jgi:hypothetical protein
MENTNSEASYYAGVYFNFASLSITLLHNKLGIYVTFTTVMWQPLLLPKQGIYITINFTCVLCKK